MVLEIWIIISQALVFAADHIDGRYLLQLHPTCMIAFMIFWLILHDGESVELNFIVWIDSLNNCSVRATANIEDTKIFVHEEFDSSRLVLFIFFCVDVVELRIFRYTTPDPEVFIWADSIVYVFPRYNLFEVNIGFFNLA